MAWNSLTLTLANPSDAETIEEHLLNLGAVAVTYTDAGDEPILEPELNTQPLWSATNINALFEIDVDLGVVKASLSNQFGADSFVIVEQGRIEDKNWEREWMDHFKPMRFGKRLWICPEGMHIPEDQQSKDNVIVDMDPGLAFGTGTHETTSLCLTWLDDAELNNKTILDYGSGSGVLAIAALKLGAEKATCLDIDIQAIEASLDNAQRNHVDDKLVAYLPNDSDWPKDEKYDVILANILASPLVALVQDIRRRVNRGGQIVLSGILAEQEAMVVSVYAPYFNLFETQYDGDWICISGTLKTPSEQLGDLEQVTRCPNCDESFYINAKDLDRANGEVRCGECNTVFYAIDFIDPLSDENKSKLTNPINSGKIPKAHLITGMWLHQKDGLTPVQHNMQQQNILQPDQQDLNTELEQDETADKAHNTGLDTGLDTGPDASTDATVEPAVDVASETQTMTDPAKHDILDDDAGSLKPHDDIKADEHTGLTETSDEPLNLDANIVTEASQLHTLNDSTPLNIDELESLQKPKLPKRNWLWFIVAAIALLALGAQYVHQHRDQLALHPRIGQPLQDLYTKLPLEIEPDWQLDAYQINSSTVALNPEQKEQLVASFNLSNMADHAQIFPIIRLSLFNRWGERIAYRDLTAKDYLPENLRAENTLANNKTMLAARGRVDIRVAVKDPGAEAMDFNVEVCLEKSGSIRCQDKTY